MDADAERIERARAKNLAYIRQKDEHEASQAVDELLGVGASSRRSCAPVSGGNKGNSSVYITGLTTYMACRQLEGACAKLGKVRRIKFYKDEKGGLKGDAVVTFGSRATMMKAIDKLNHFEVKPGVVITATEATFSGKKVKNTGKSKGIDGGVQRTAFHETSAPSKACSADEKPPLNLPSDAVILKNVWDSLDSSDAAFFTELEEDMRVECARHGVVKRVQIVAHGSVIVHFAELNAAIACQKMMNGRWFAGRQIEAQFDQATTENLSDADAKVQAFLASIEE